MPDDDALNEASPALTGDEALRLANVSLEQGLDAVYWLDATSHIVYVNAAACQMLGYERDELVRMTAADVRPSFHEDAILPGVTHISVTSLRHKDGHLVEVEERATRLDTAGRRFVVVTARALPEPSQAAAPAARHVEASGMPPPGAPLRVLIVEDERIQQRIIRDMLERLGAIVETAGTGREAVESVRKGPDRFGAILMDMLMPEMDGIEAARIIRREFPDHAVPIIATTASAQPAEIDACLAAGMNGHVSKPFDVRQLEAALSRWTKLAPTGRGTQAEHPDARAQGGPADLSAVKGVDTASALARLNGHRDLFVRLLKGFVEDYRSAPASIGAAIARGDLDAALRMAHNLKGVAGTLSANAVYGAARALEASLREGRHHELAGTCRAPERGARHGLPVRGRLGDGTWCRDWASRPAVVRSVGRRGRPRRVRPSAEDPEVLRARTVRSGEGTRGRPGLRARPRRRPGLPRPPGLPAGAGIAARAGDGARRAVLPVVRTMMAAARQTILLVDDAPANLEALNAVLGADYDLIFATSSQEAIELARDQLPDLILLDVMMPGMDGREACRRLKADALTAGIPVIFVTGMDHEEDEAAGLDAGAIDYLAKPIRASIVKARVRNHLELKRARDLLESLSITDQLTGLPNRRQFDAVLETEVRRALRNKSHVGLLMCDLDRFKAYNDHYGHPAGDVCLQEVAAVFRDTLRRAGDLPARYGGEEFAVILPGVKPHDAGLIGERIRQAVEARQLPHAPAESVPFVTVSIGATSVLVTEDRDGGVDRPARGRRALREQEGRPKPRHLRGRLTGTADLRTCDL